ncbi:hypothetical protein HDU98_009730 [Podochytrium sp. JEL0797]|nr:hypothetical protein HDU98_009730 [Podochytrium sp. JEL0797]
MTIAYDPNWPFVLASTESNLSNSATHTFPGAVLSLSSNPHHSKLHINTEDPASQAMDAPAVRNMANHAIQLLQESKSLPRVMYDVHWDHAEGVRVADVWHQVLTDLGMETESSDWNVTSCLAVLEEGVLGKGEDAFADMPWISCVRATTRDLQGALDTEPGEEGTLVARTEKCKQVLGRREEDGVTYLCYLNGVAVAKMSVVVVPQGGGLLPVGFVSEVNTRDQFQEDGFASRVVRFGLKDLFERRVVETVVVFEDNGLPIKMFKSLGFKCVKELTKDSAWEKAHEITQLDTPSMADDDDDLFMADDDGVFQPVRIVQLKTTLPRPILPPASLKFKTRLIETWNARNPGANTLISRLPFIPQPFNDAMYERAFKMWKYDTSSNVLVIGIARFLFNLWEKIRNDIPSHEVGDCEGVLGVSLTSARCAVVLELIVGWEACGRLTNFDFGEDGWPTCRFP